MAIDEVGRFFSLVALTVIGWSAGDRSYRSASTKWRILAATGEVLYFWTPWSTVGGALFVAGAVLTVYHVVRGTAWQGEVSRVQKDAIELIELIAWLWMLDALR